jgi:hypothetical protein
MEAPQRPFRKSRIGFAVVAKGNQALHSKSRVMYKQEAFTLAVVG